MNSGHFFEDLTIGQTANLAKTIADGDVLMHSAASMDTNPVHVDGEAAKTLMFGERIAHGVLSAGLISAVLGTKPPCAGSFDTRQSPRFAAPVKTGQPVRAVVAVTGLSPEMKRATLKTICMAGGELMIEGAACAQVPSRD